MTLLCVERGYALLIRYSGYVATSNTRRNRLFSFQSDLRDCIKMPSLDDFEQTAKEKLPDWIMNYYATGTGEEQTLQENKAAYKR